MHILQAQVHDCIIDVGGKQGLTQGGVGVNPLELDILRMLYYLRKGNCVRILFAC